MDCPLKWDEAEQVVSLVSYSVADISCMIWHAHQCCGLFQSCIISLSQASFRYMHGVMKVLWCKGTINNTYLDVTFYPSQNDLQACQDSLAASHPLSTALNFPEMRGTGQD